MIKTSVLKEIGKELDAWDTTILAAVDRLGIYADYSMINTFVIHNIRWLNEKLLPRLEKLCKLGLLRCIPGDVEGIYQYWEVTEKKKQLFKELKNQGGV